MTNIRVFGSSSGDFIVLQPNSCADAHAALTSATHLSKTKIALATVSTSPMMTEAGILRVCFAAASSGGDSSDDYVDLGYSFTQRSPPSFTPNRTSTGAEQIINVSNIGAGDQVVFTSSGCSNLSVFNTSLNTGTDAAFHVSSEAMNWDQGFMYCSSQNMVLATIKSAAELQLARTIIWEAGVTKAITAAYSHGNGWTWGGTTQWHAHGFPLNTGHVIHQRNGGLDAVYSVHGTGDLIFEAVNRTESHSVLCRNQTVYSNDSTSIQMQVTTATTGASAIITELFDIIHNHQGLMLHTGATPGSWSFCLRPIDGDWSSMTNQTLVIVPAPEFGPHVAIAGSPTKLSFPGVEVSYAFVRYTGT